MKTNKSLIRFFALLLMTHFLIEASYADKAPRFVGTIAVSKDQKNQYPDLAKISFQQVLDIFSKNHQGKIVEVALEREDGFLVYEVELITSEKIKKKVIIDAGNGSVLFVKEKRN